MHMFVGDNKTLHTHGRGRVVRVKLEIASADAQHQDWISLHNVLSTKSKIAELASR